MDILNISDTIEFDNSIVRSEVHTHLPYSSNSFNNNDTITIPLNQKDTFFLISDSAIYIEGTLLTADGKPTTTGNFVNNGIIHLFDEIRYEIGGKVVDRIRNPGITSTMKTFVSLTKSEWDYATMAGFHLYHFNERDKTSGLFNVCIPLKYLLGFAEDYKKILINVNHELVLIRSNNDNNAVHTTKTDEKLKVTINKIAWRVPHITVADAERLNIIQYVASGADVDIPFRSWGYFEYPLLPRTQQHTWSIKSSSQLEKPRYVLLAFQTDKKNNIYKNNSTFNHCNLTDIKLFLNSEQFPYETINANFSQSKFTILYDMYTKFQSSYYNRIRNEPIVSTEKYPSDYPFIVIDCSRQSEILNSGSVDVRLDFQTNADIPDNTSLYCIIIHDRILKYNPLTGNVISF